MDLSAVGLTVRFGALAALNRVDLEVAAGEYAYVARDFVNLLGAVDCLQADVTRCGGITGVLAAGGLAQAHALDLSAHCAPAIPMPSRAIYKRWSRFRTRRRPSSK